MNDQDLKNLFKSMKQAEPTELEIARWRRVLRQELRDRSPQEWMRLATACMIGVLIGAVAFHGGKTKIPQENFAEDATIEVVHVNLD